MVESSQRSVLFIAPVPPPITGQAVACEILYNHLREAGDRVTLINLTKGSFRQGVNSLGRLLEIARILLCILWSAPRAQLCYFTPSESVAGNLKDLLIYALCWLKLRRMVIHLHGGASMRKILSRDNPILLRLNGFFLRRIGAAIVLGDRLKPVYEGLLPSSRIHAVPNFAGSEYFVNLHEVEEKFRAFAPMRILFLSNLLPGKGHQELISALALLTPEERCQLQVDIAGGFEHPEDRLRVLQQIAGIGDLHATLHGVVYGETKRDLLRNAHLFCLPTYYPYEGQPISILEAYASGCAVLTTDHSGIFDTFTPGTNGYQVEPRSPESIAQAIRHALIHRDLLHQWARNNLQQAERRYRPAEHLRALDEVFAAVSTQSR